MEHAIKIFNQQFTWNPKIENGSHLPKADSYLVAGMGGSHLAADLLKTWRPDLTITIHEDYGLPALSPLARKKILIIASSYSGNTEEVLDAFEEAVSKKLPIAAISVGGKLLQRARQRGIPFIEMPDTGVQPRAALGYSFRGLLKLMRQSAALAETAKLARTLNPSSFRANGKELARRLKGRIPIIYASARNAAIAYNWKIKFNETAKIPAFYNTFPELNHNEMTGFDVAPSTRKLSKSFYVIILRDQEDHPRIQKRMHILQKLYQDRGLPTEEIRLHADRGPFYKIFSSTLLADWCAFFTAETYGLDSEQVPMVEEFKKLMQK